MNNCILKEQDCDRRLVEYKYNANDKCYERIKHFKFNSQMLSIDKIKQYFIDKNKAHNNDFAFMVLNVNAVPPTAIPMPCKLCDYRQ